MAALTPDDVLALQRTVGNAGVSEMVGRSPVLDVVGSGGGSPLDADTRTDMEARLGHDFGDVRVHTDSRAHDSAVAVSADAYTVGSEIVFQRGRFDPSSGEGRKMLAHELTHVVQQRSGPVSGTPTGDGVAVSDPSDAFEREAEETAESAMACEGAEGRRREPGGIVVPTVLDTVPIEVPEHDEVEPSGNVSDGPSPSDDRPSDSETAIVDWEEREEAGSDAMPRQPTEGLLRGLRTAQDGVPEPAPDDEHQRESSTSSWSRDRTPDWSADDASLAAARPENETSADLYDAVHMTDCAGRMELCSALTDVMAVHRSTVLDELDRVDRHEAIELALVTAAINGARDRMVGALGTARVGLDRDEVETRSTVRARHVAQQEHALSVVAGAQARVRSSGQTFGGAAIDTGNEVADGVLDRTREQARCATTRSRASATRLAGADSPSTAAMREAASQVGAQTATEIQRALGTTEPDLRAAGPEVRNDLLRRSDVIAREIGRSTRPVAAALTKINAQAEGGIAEIGVAGKVELDQLESSLTNELNDLVRAARMSIRHTAAAARVAVAESASATEAAFVEEGGRALTTGRETTRALLAQVTSRPVRRVVARQLRTSISATLPQAYGVSAAHARELGAAMAGQFLAANAAIHESISLAGREGASRGEQIVGEGVSRAERAQALVAQRLGAMLDQAAARGGQLADGLFASVSETSAKADEGLARAVRDLRGRLEHHGREAGVRTGEPLETLDERMAEAAESARRRVEDGWFLSQLRDAWDALTPGFITSLVVGLLVTIAVVAICGTGIGALILAGALAGAASGVTSSATDFMVGAGRYADGKEWDWGEVGREAALGAAFGAAGGALGAGVSGALSGRTGSVLSGAARSIFTRASTQQASAKVADVVLGVGLGVTQNIVNSGMSEGWDHALDRWDQGLLLNAAVSSVMVSDAVGRRVHAASEHARAAMVDRGLALNVTLAELNAGRVALSEQSQAASDTTQARESSGGSAQSAELDRAHVVEDNESSRPAGAHDESVAARTDLENLLDAMPDETVMQPPDPRDASGAMEMYRNTVLDDPFREAAIYRNTKTGEYIVIQGDSSTVQVGGGEGPAPGGYAQNWKEILDGRPDVGSWEMQAHSHPSEKHTGIVDPVNQWPSGAHGDMGVMWFEGQQSGRARISRIDYTTADGSGHTYYGYDPASEMPFWVDRPDGATSRVIDRFATIEAYHEFLDTTLGAPQGDVPDSMKASPASGDGSVSDTDRTVRQGSTEMSSGSTPRGSVVAVEDERGPVRHSAVLPETGRRLARVEQLLRRRDPGDVRFRGEVRSLQVEYAAARDAFADISPDHPERSGGMAALRAVEDALALERRAAGLLARMATEPAVSQRQGAFDNAAFLERIRRLPVGERVGEIETVGGEIAASRGWTYDTRLSSSNNRSVYREPGSGNLFGVDTLHGSFERCNSAGKHLEEVNFVFERLSGSDLSGKHDLEVR